MSDKKNSDAFDLLNSEFANLELEKENARNLENLRRRQALSQQTQTAETAPEEDGEEDDGESGGSGCFGVAFRILLILLLAGALAWMVFMPDGSVGELWDKTTPKIESAWSWITDIFAGKSDGGSADSTDASSGTVRQTPTDNAATVSTRQQTTTTAAAAGEGQTAQTAETGQSRKDFFLFVGQVGHSHQNRGICHPCQVPLAFHGRQLLHTVCLVLQQRISVSFHPVWRKERRDHVQFIL